MSKTIRITENNVEKIVTRTTVRKIKLDRQVNSYDMEKIINEKVKEINDDTKI